MNSKKRILLYLALWVTLICNADQLTDLVTGKYKCASLPEMVSLSDGERYATLRDNKVIVYSYKTGKPLDTLFDATYSRDYEIDSIEGIILSKTGEYMLLYNHSESIFRRSKQSDYYLLNIKYRELKKLGAGISDWADKKITAAVFSPNGQYVAFSAANNLYLHKVLYGTEVAVTTDGSQGAIINGVADWLYEEEFSLTGAFSFSPDSKQLAFLRLDESDVPIFSWQTFLNTRYPQTHSLKYPKAGEANALASVRVYDIYYKSIKTMDIGDITNAYIPRLSWTGQENQLAIFKLNRNQTKVSMYFANVKSTVSQLIYEESLKDGYINYEHLNQWRFLSDGRFVVVNETDGFCHAHMYSAQGLKISSMASQNYDITDVYGYDELNDVLYYQAAPIASERQIFAYSFKKNKVVMLTEESGSHYASFSSNYQYFVDHFSSLTVADRYWLLNSSGKLLRKLQNNHDIEQEFAALGLSEKQFFTFSTERGDKLYGWMLFPAGFSKEYQYPVVQIQYSGPASQLVRNIWKKDWEYDLANKGYIVVCVDGRGTDCRGTKWRRLTYKKMGIMEAEDQVSTARYMQSLPYVDANRIAIWGWSFGGYMTLMSMSQPHSPFKCGISVAPVIDWRHYDSAYTERFMTRPQENNRGYEDASLLPRAKDLQGRLLLMHGMADDNVHIQQTWQYINALVEAEIQFEMQVYPDDNHFLKSRTDYSHVYHRFVDFFSRNL